MREILFRGKEKYHHTWVEGWYCPNVFGRFPPEPAMVSAEDANDGYWHPEPVFLETVGQYTGLTDKNGKKIFEGDIVRTTLPLSTDKYKKGVVLFGEYDTAYHSGIIGFYVDWDFNPSLAIYCRFNDIEVIGNIHDNPELLQREEVM